MKNDFISNSIWFLASIALIFALVAMTLDAGAQSLDDPTPTPTEINTCWFDEQEGHWICIGSVPTEPTPTATPMVTPPAPVAAYVYLPVVARNPAMILTPRAEVE